MEVHPFFVASFEVPAQLPDMQGLLKQHGPLKAQRVMLTWRLRLGDQRAQQQLVLEASLISSLSAGNGFRKFANAVRVVGSQLCQHNGLQCFGLQGITICWQGARLASMECNWWFIEAS